jgi:hypothetical protein
MILGVQRWLCLLPNQFVDEPSDADRHEQDRDRVVPNGGHHRAEDVTEATLEAVLHLEHRRRQAPALY